MRIGVIVQRYGADVVGGAERLSRGVAEGLAARGHHVEVLTTCARSYRTWANAYPEGPETVRGVLVRRFRCERERDMAAFNELSTALFAGPRTADDEIAWVEAQGPYVPRLLDHLRERAQEFDRLLFFTYLYYPTVHGIHVAPRRSVLVPTAHDEPPLYLGIYEGVFAAPAGMVFNTEAEAALADRRFRRLPARTAVIGVGIDVPGAPAARRPATADGSPGSDDELDPARDGGPPAVLYAGRIEGGKGVAELIDDLRRFRRDTGLPARLWLLGELAMEVPEEDWIEVLGYVPEPEKVSRLGRAAVVVLPSALESFAIVALEAMAAGTPVLVNAGSEAAVEHCRRGNGGLYYENYAEFREALRLLLADEQLRRALARRGSRYVAENFTWPRVVERYEGFLAAL